MILTIDIGNTCTHLGLFQKDKLISSTKYQNKFKNKYGSLIKKFIDNSVVANVGISSVVPGLNKFYEKFFIKNYNLSPIFISNKLRLPIKIKIKHPQELGADRICGSVFGFEYFKEKENVLIIDSGTAITYDIVTKKGDYIGGAIAPGMELLSKSLNLYTAKLPLINITALKFPIKTIAKDTREAISTGIVFSTVDSINGMVSRIEKHFDGKIEVILTGGNAQLIIKKLEHPVSVLKNCVPEGINLILRYQNGF